MDIYILVNKDKDPYFDCMNGTSCLCSVVALDARFVDHMAGLYATEAGNELSQTKLVLLVT